MSRGERCANCDEPARGRHGLPVNDQCDFVPAGDTSQEWGGVPACEQCNAMHAAAGDRCNEVLEAYAKATEQLREQLQQARRVLEAVRSDVGDILDHIGSSK